MDKIKKDIKLKLFQYRERRTEMLFNQGIAHKLGFNEQVLKLQSDSYLLMEFIDFLKDIDVAIEAAEVKVKPLE